MVNHKALVIIVLATFVFLPSLQATEKSAERKAETPPPTSRPSSVEQLEFSSFRRHSVSRAASMPGSLPFDFRSGSFSSRRASGTPRTPDQFSQLKNTSFGTQLAQQLKSKKVAALPKQFIIDYTTLSLIARLNPDDKDTIQRSFLKLFTTKIGDIDEALATTLDGQNLHTLASGTINTDEFSSLVTFLSPIRSNRTASTESSSPISTPELKSRRLAHSPSLGAQNATSPVPGLHLSSTHSSHSSPPFRRAASTESPVPPLQLSSILSPHSSPPLTGRRGQADLPLLAISSPPSASSAGSPGSHNSPQS